MLNVIIHEAALSLLPGSGVKQMVTHEIHAKIDALSVITCSLNLLNPKEKNAANKIAERSFRLRKGNRNRRREATKIKCKFLNRLGNQRLIIFSRNSRGWALGVMIMWEGLKTVEKIKINRTLPESKIVLISRKRNYPENMSCETGYKMGRRRFEERTW